MWKIFHSLFGWEYVHLENSAHEIIRRVRYTEAGEPYCVYCASMLIFVARDDCRWSVTPLTWDPAAV